MESLSELESKLRTLCEPQVRDRLLARGLARGMIWIRGEVPSDGPDFAPLLTNDLLNHGYQVLGCSLRLRTITGDVQSVLKEVISDGFRTAAECIESAVRRGANESDRGFHLTVAAASFHLAHLSARAFSLLHERASELNLAAVEKVLGALIRRDLDGLQNLCLEWFADESHTDEGIANDLENDDSDLDPLFASYLVVAGAYIRAVASFEFALRTGSEESFLLAIEELDGCLAAASEIAHVPLWWVCVLTRHLIDDLWDNSLHRRLPLSPDDEDWNRLRRNFIDILCHRNIAEVDLWPSQLAAASRAVDESDDLVVALPTSSGKTRIAELCILKCLASRKRVIYVTPLRALSAQVEQTLRRTFSPLGFSVSSVYGASGIAASDVDTMRRNNIVIATPEKLDFATRQDPTVIDEVGLIVLDEGHMIGLNEREIRYEILVQRLLRRSDNSKRRIVCLSAIFQEGPVFDSFTNWIRNDEPGEPIRSVWRPTRQRPGTLVWKKSYARLDYEVDSENVFVEKFIEETPPQKPRRKPFPKDKNELLVAAALRFSKDGHSVLVYCPMRKSVESTAEVFLRVIDQGYAASFLPRGVEATDLQRAIRVGEEWLGNSHVAVRALRHGIAVHHGQLPRSFLSEIERLLKRGTLKVAISSPTLAQGVDLAFGVLLLGSLWRNGSIIPPKEFANVVGRVGRAFVDLDGIFILPVFEDKPYSRQKRSDEFWTLFKKAKERTFESGVYLLIKICLERLTESMGISDGSLIEYVLNNQSEIDSYASQQGDEEEQMSVILAELDAGILASVEDLECADSELISLLDTALQSSLWRRRLATLSPDEQAKQEALVRGRAMHIWSRTQSTHRSGFFAAGIGLKSGQAILALSATLKELFASCVEKLLELDTSAFAGEVCKLADLLLSIYPFEPDSIRTDWTNETWHSLIAEWLSGRALSEFADPDAVAFIQEGVVFKLVWSIEAARIIVEQENPEELAPESTLIGLCLTYGTPFPSAARLLEAGLESRLLAVRISMELNLTWTSRDGLLMWLLVLEELPMELDSNETEIWRQFRQRSDFFCEEWERVSFICRFRRHPQYQLKIGERVRLVAHDGKSLKVLSAQLIHVGFAIVPENQKTKTAIYGQVLSDDSIEVSFFGPATPTE